MIEQRLAVFRPEFLPENAVVTAQSVATQAPQEIILDGAYSLTFYDPSLQTREVQEHYASLPITRVAQIACWAAGADRHSTQLILGETEKNGGYKELTIKQRLHHALAAAPRVWQYFDVGLLQGSVSIGEDDNAILALSLNEKRLLHVLTKGINANDTRTLSMLLELDRKYYETEPSLLAVLSKYLITTSGERSVKDPAIVHFDAGHDRYAGSVIIPYKPPDVVSAPEEKRPARILDVSHTVVGPLSPEFNNKQLNQRRYRQTEERRQRRHKALVHQLAESAAHINRETGACQLSWKGTSFTFDFDGLLTDKRTMLAALYMCGLQYEEMKPWLPKADARYKTYMTKIRERLEIPDGVDLTLFAIAKRYLTFDKPTEPQQRPKIIPEANRSVMRCLIEDGYTYKALSAYVPYALLARSMGYCMDQFDVTNARELTLAAATHGMVQIPNRLLPASALSSSDTFVAAQTVAKKSLDLDVQFRDKLVEYVETSASTGEVTVNWRNAEFIFDFGEDFPIYHALVAALQFFGISQQTIEANGLITSGESYDIYHAVRQELGIPRYHRSGAVRRMAERKYIKKVDTTAYELVEPDLSKREEQVLTTLYRHERPIIPEVLPMTKPSVNTDIGHMYRLFGIVANPSRLLIAGALEGKLPELSRQFAAAG